MNFQAPSLRRRMAAFVYEGTLLFGVVMLFGMVYSISIGQRHALYARHGLEAFVFLALGWYFSWFWSKGGQTLAMKTWKVRLVSTSGRPISQPQALLRYVVSWIWFMPGLLLAYLHQGHTAAQIMIYPVVWVVAYALSSFLHPQRQFWHDVLCGTRIVASDATLTTSTS